MDDANVPSLLALPYLGFCAPDDPRYLRTRAFVLSADNPHFISGIAASGVGNLRKMLAHVAETAPLRRNVTIEDVGNVGAFLCSDLAAGVTGEVTYVDCGYSILGMTAIVDP